jgi:hypothetical protein
VDALDISNLESEVRHEFEARVSPGGGPNYWRTVVRDLGFPAYPGLDPRAHAIDGGRDLKGAASFMMRIKPGRPAVLFLRVASPQPDTLTIRMGSWSERLPIPRDEVRFNDLAVVIAEVAANSADQVLDPRNAAGASRLGSKGGARSLRPPGFEPRGPGENDLEPVAMSIEGRAFRMFHVWLMQERAP